MTRPSAAMAPPGRGSFSASAIRLRMLAVAGMLIVLHAAIAGKLLRLALENQAETRTASAEPLAGSFARPDIVDRQGRLIATDITGHSLFADPSRILDADEAAEKLARTLPGLEASELRQAFADRDRRFVWIRRGLAPVEAQRVHDLGLPGLAFRREPKRAYPAGLLVGHIVGLVNPDNRGVTGLERTIDETLGMEPVHGAAASRLAAVRLTLDLGAQFALADELAKAAARYDAAGAAGIILEAGTGAIVASYSWPPVDPNAPGAALDTGKPDRVQGGVYELGSIMKVMTVAMALEGGAVTLSKTYDLSQPLSFGRFTIRDLHPHPGQTTVRDIFVRSSNVGAGQMALEAGTQRQRAFLDLMGLTRPMRTEAGPVAPPLLPDNWGQVETATIAFGHGLAMAPMQFAAAGAALVNGGHRIVPTYLETPAPSAPPVEAPVISPKTSEAIREIMRLNVTLPYGTGRRARAEGYRVGGKTGTAEIPGKGGYKAKSVIASFFATLPTDRPRYVVLVSLFEPHADPDAGSGITAGVNAAPVTGAVIARVAPILGILPRRIETGPGG